MNDFSSLDGALCVLRVLCYDYGSLDGKMWNAMDADGSSTVCLCLMLFSSVYRSPRKNERCSYAVTGRLVAERSDSSSIAERGAAEGCWLESERR